MQRKFKLIKKYKNHKKGLIVGSWKGFDGKSNCYKSETIGTLKDFKFSAFDAYEVENSEFWEEIFEEEEQSYRFFIDEKVEVWRRYYYEIDDTKENAIARMKNVLLEKSNEDGSMYDSELIYDTEVSLGVRELFNEQGEQL